jgi:hypothetical protein
MPNDLPTVSDLKQMHKGLSSLPDEELIQIHILSPGTALDNGAAYLDLKDLASGEILATNNMIAGEDNWYVAKQDTPYNLWSVLLGLDQHQLTDTEVNKQTA